MIILYRIFTIWIRFMILASAIKNAAAATPKAKPVITS